VCFDFLGEVAWANLGYSGREKERRLGTGCRELLADQMSFKKAENFNFSYDFDPGTNADRFPSQDLSPFLKVSIASGTRLYSDFCCERGELVL